MITYKILSTQQNQETLITKVEFNINGEIVVCDVNHFMINSEEEITTNIINMAKYQEARLLAINNITDIANNIELNQVITIN